MNEQNLKPFQPGQSGNPNGRPKNTPGLGVLLSEVLGGDDLPEARKILLALVQRAQKGNVRAAQLILDRTFGKVSIPLSVEVTKGFLNIDPLEDEVQP